LVVALQRVHGHLFSLGPGNAHGFGALVIMDATDAVPKFGPWIFLENREL
jgi:hypothetical protein